MNFDTWWHQEGSGIIPNDKEDMEEFAKRIAKIAWSNGEYVERERCAKIALSGTGMPVQVATLKILKKERERIAAAIFEMDKDL